MLPLRFSFWLRFCLSFFAVAGFAFSCYAIAAVLFFAPAPIPPAYDIAPRQTELRMQAAVKQNEAAERHSEEAAAEAAAQAAKRIALAEEGNIAADNAIYPFFAQADLKRGRRIFSGCTACHSSAKDGGNRVGPPLWGINGRSVAAIRGFTYSSAMRAFAEKQVKWDLAALDRFLSAPAANIKGTTMIYRGVKDLQERADLLLYLESLSDAVP